MKKVQIFLIFIEKANKTAKCMHVSLIIISPPNLFIVLNSQSILAVSSIPQVTYIAMNWCPLSRVVCRVYFPLISSVHTASVGRTQNIVMTTPPPPPRGGGASGGGPGILGWGGGGVEFFLKAWGLGAP